MAMRSQGEAEVERLFVALMLTGEPCAVVAEQVQPRLEQVGGSRTLRLTRPEGWHLTLAFLGDVALERRARLAAALGERLAGARAPELALDHTGAFPARGRERVLWIGVAQAEEERLLELQRRTLDAVAEAGLPRPMEAERFHPHVTVARPRRPALDSLGASAFYAPVTPVEWHPRAVAGFAGHRTDRRGCARGGADLR